ncbi:MAG: hypothetical protein GY845_01465 [Planctomycetes bacterium]|nr:hypothetical protein [Planctomycetota bacterium]
MKFDEIIKQSKDRGIDLAEYEETYEDMLNRKVSRLDAHSYDEWGDKRKIREYSLILRQILLHRAIKLFEGALFGLINDNGYSMCLCVRGHFETTASIGYLHNKLYSLKQGNVSAESVDRDISVQLLGTRDEMMLKKFQPYISEAKQILKLLEYADRSVSKHVLKGKVKEHTMLMDCYKFLCEFSHPNFHSNQQSFTINKEENCFMFKHDDVIHERDANLLGYLLISNPIFVDLYDLVIDLVPE